MASYDFVPYALTGLSAAMQTPGEGARAATTVTVPIEDDKGGKDAAGQDVTIFGPGDVLGVDPGQIVRRYPAPGSTNAEETFHAHIEFDRPEVPWAFSAQTPQDTMQAWLALVVLERDEVELGADAGRAAARSCRSTPRACRRSTRPGRGLTLRPSAVRRP